MTELRQLLNDIADRAQPPVGLAERALASRTARRPSARLRGLRPGWPGSGPGWLGSRRRVVAPVVAAVVGVSTLVVAVALVAPSSRPNGGTGAGASARTAPSTASGWPVTVDFPKTAQPLPGKGVGPVVLAYQRSCDTGDRYQGCVQSRVLTSDGRHYEVTAATPAPSPTRGIPGAEAVSVSPDGSRIAYTHGCALVLRDLASGRVRTIATLGRTTDQLDLQWSHDGRWLGMIEDDFFDSPRSTLIDIAAGKATKLPESATLLGLPDGDALIPVTWQRPGNNDLALFDHAGRQRGSMPATLFGSHDADGILGQIAPNGRTLAAITFPKKNYVAPTVLALGVSPARLEHRFPVHRAWNTWDSPQFEGWYDDQHVLIRTTQMVEAGKDRMRTTGYSVDAVDIRTGAMTRVYRFPARLRSVSIAVGRL